jgi:hypothetical protein
MTRLGLLLLGLVLGGMLVSVALELPVASSLPMLRRFVFVASAVIFAVGFIGVNGLRGSVLRGAALGGMVLAAMGFLIAGAGAHMPAWVAAGIALTIFGGVGLAGVFLARGLARPRRDVSDGSRGGGFP